MKKTKQPKKLELKKNTIQPLVTLTDVVGGLAGKTGSYCGTYCNSCWYTE